MKLLRLGLFAAILAGSASWLSAKDEAAPKDWVGSSLVGYYGVRKKDGAVLEWNVIDDTPGALLKERNPWQPPLPKPANVTPAAGPLVSMPPGKAGR